MSRNCSAVGSTLAPLHYLYIREDGGTGNISTSHVPILCDLEGVRWSIGDVAAQGAITPLTPCVSCFPKRDSLLLPIAKWRKFPVKRVAGVIPFAGTGRGKLAVYFYHDMDDYPVSLLLEYVDSDRDLHSSIPAMRLGRAWCQWLPLLSFYLPLGSATSTCKCLSYEPCWPSASEFSQLTSQLSQPLIYPKPPASACYPPSQPSGNCTAALSHLDDGNWRSNLPGAMQNINFESYTFKNGTIDACYYNHTLGYPCEQGNIATVGVNVAKVSDIQAAVKFAGKHNLRLVVKNTGHDYLGRSMARGAFMIWTHNLKDIAYDDNFVPDGGSSKHTFKALTLGAGVQWHEAYAAAESHRRIVVGGASSGGSVGAAGGWIQGGGHSALAPKYGLGVDNAIQFTVVLASGDYVTVNRFKYADLFWALRGGGGGTFGVVVSVTYQTHDILPVSGAFILANFSTPQMAQKVVTEYIKLHPKLSDAGWGGYSFYSNAEFRIIYIGTNISLSEAEATMTPFFEYAGKTIGNPKDYQSLITNFTSFYDWYSFTFRSSTGQVGKPSEAISRFFSRKIAEEQPEKVAEVTLRVVNGISLNFVAGGTVSRHDPHSAGLNPAWRESLGEAAASLDLLDTITPDSGTYFNEASLYEKDFKKTFFGSHYPALEAIKHKYDPNDLFLVAEGVGSENWDQSLNCRIH
ncbi:hypothetical protein APHAL10511_005151 [Amanita phalloides]|nr:hypothetical protein APHAL10511_005151 [Amanita phalloides]